MNLERAAVANVGAVSAVGQAVRAGASHAELRHLFEVEADIERQRAGSVRSRIEDWKKEGVFGRIQIRSVIPNLEFLLTSILSPVSFCRNRAILGKLG